MAEDRVYNSIDSTQPTFPGAYELSSFPNDSVHISSLFMSPHEFQETSSVSFALSEAPDTVSASHWAETEDNKELDKNEDTGQPLKLLKRKGGKHVKKAYFRIQVIRAFKKSLRQIATRKWAKGGIYQLKKGDKEHKRLWSDYYQCYKTEKAWLSDEDITVAQGTAEKSFNNAYCRRLFTPEGLRKLYFHFVDLVFRNDSTPDEFCEKFNLQCCSGSHSEECPNTWREVKRFVRLGLFQDFGLRPWNGSQWVSASDLEPEQFLVAKPS